MFDRSAVTHSLPTCSFLAAICSSHLIPGSRDRSARVPFPRSPSRSSAPRGGATAKSLSWRVASTPEFISYAVPGSRPAVPTVRFPAELSAAAARARARTRFLTSAGPEQASTCLGCLPQVGCSSGYEGESDTHDSLLSCTRRHPGVRSCPCGSGEAEISHQVLGAEGVVSCRKRAESHGSSARRWPQGGASGPPPPRGAAAPASVCPLRHGF